MQAITKKYLTSDTLAIYKGENIKKAKITRVKFADSADYATRAHGFLGDIMLPLLIILLLCSSLSAADDWLAWDKAEHIGLYSFLTVASYLNMQHYDLENGINQKSLVISACYIFTTGVLHEISDYYRWNEASGKDIIANLIGVSLGVLVIQMIWGK